jgi:transcriptional regulator
MRRGFHSGEILGRALSAANGACQTFEVVFEGEIAKENLAEVFTGGSEGEEGLEPFCDFARGANVHEPRIILGQELRDRAPAGRDDRQAEGHCLDQDEAETLGVVVSWEAKAVAFGQNALFGGAKDKKTTFPFLKPDNSRIPVVRTFEPFGASHFPFDNRQERGHCFPVEHLELRFMMKEIPDLLQGTLDLLILKALQLGPMHGFGISALIRRMSKQVLQVEQGSLYPALYRLEDQGWIESEWGVSEHNRKAKFYKLTPTGRKQLVEERSNWDRISTAVNLVLRTT